MCKIDTFFYFAFSNAYALTAYLEVLKGRRVQSYLGITMGQSEIRSWVPYSLFRLGKTCVGKERDRLGMMYFVISNNVTSTLMS